MASLKKSCGWRNVFSIGFRHDESGPVRDIAIKKNDETNIFSSLSDLFQSSVNSEISYVYNAAVKQKLQNAV